MSLTKPSRKRVVGLVVAILGFCLFSSAGKYLVFHLRPHAWGFPILGDSWDFQYTYIPYFYLAFFGSQLGATAFLACTIRVFRFDRPQRTAFWTLLILAVLGLLLSVTLKWSWSGVPYVNHAFAFACYAASVLLLAPVGVACICLMDLFVDSPDRSDCVNARPFVFFRSWRRLRWFLVLAVPIIASAVAMLLRGCALFESVLAFVVGLAICAILFMVLCSGLLVTHQGTCGRRRDPAGFWLTVAVLAAGYLSVAAMGYFFPVVA